MTIPRLSLASPIVRFVLALAALFTLALFVRVVEESPPVSEVSEDETAAERVQFAAIGERVERGSIALTVNEAAPTEDTVAGEENAPASGHHFVAVDVTIEASGTEVVSFGLLDFTARDTTGLEYEVVLTVSPPNRLASGNLAPGDVVRGRVPFEVPVGTPLTLVFSPSALRGEAPIRVDLGTP